MLRRSDSNAARLELKLRWTDYRSIRHRDGKEEKKKKLTLGEYSVGALRFQLYVGSCNITNVISVL
jgi:hypothetical protein